LEEFHQLFFGGLRFTYASFLQPFLQTVGLGSRIDMNNNGSIVKDFGAKTTVSEKGCIYILSIYLYMAVQLYDINTTWL